MPREKDEQIEAIIESCMQDEDMTEKECTDMAYAVVNSEEDKTQKAVYNELT